MKNRKMNNVTIISNRVTEIDLYGHVNFMQGNIYSAAKNDEDFTDIAKIHHLIEEKKEVM